MKWFQHNRALGTLLVVSGVCILLGAALLYWRWSVWSEAKQTFDQATAERNRLQGLNPFPNDANYRKLQGYLERYNVALDKFKGELKAEVAPAPPLAPNEFQSRLRQTTLAAEERARTNNVKLPDKFQLGFDEFARMMPSTAVTVLLGQELSQVQMLINILLDAKVDSITSFRRHWARAGCSTSAAASATASTCSRRARPSVSTSTRALAGQERETVVADMRALPVRARRASRRSFRCIARARPGSRARLAEAARVLEPDGVAVFVTPNRLTLGRPDEIIDPYHYVEFDAVELRELCLERTSTAVELRGLFGTAALHGALRRGARDARPAAATGSAAVAAAGAGRGAPLPVRPDAARLPTRRDPRAAAITPGDFDLRDGGLEAALDLCAICSSPKTR